MQISYNFYCFLHQKVTQKSGSLRITACIHDDSAAPMKYEVRIKKLELRS